MRPCLPSAERANGAGYRRGDGLGGVQLDVNTAFLYAFLEEDVHVEAAPGYEKVDKDGFHSS